MKKVFALLAITSLFATSAFAILDDGVSSLGAYFDSPDFEMNCFNPTPNVPYTVYWVLANPDLPNLGGFEFGWGFDPPVSPEPFILAVNLPPGALNIGTNYNLVVGLGAGLITSEATVLVSFQMLALADVADETYVTAGPATPDSIDGEAAYNDFNNPSDIRIMNWATVDGVDVVRDDQGWVRPGLAKLSCPAPVATEAQTWGTMKALFE